MKTIKYISIGLICLFSLVITAQERQIKKLSDDFDKFAYVKTSEVLLKVAEKGYRSVELFQKLGNSYYFLNNMEAAAKWYKELMSMTEDLDAEYFFRYAQALKGIENYDEADKWMGKFYAAKPDDFRAKKIKTREDYLAYIESVSNKKTEIENLNINSEVSDFGSAIHNGELVFASSRDKGKKYKWNEQPFLDLYSAKIIDDTNFETPKKLNEDINTKYHESSAAYTPNGKFMFFTRNNYYNKKYKKDESGINRLKLFRATINTVGEWGNISSVHFNDETYSVAHPTINAKGDKLYFASDMEGTIGRSDIFMVDINSDGTLGTPVNIGNKINTEASESFPFINSKGDLFFSSNGYPGLGGMDIYVVRDFEYHMVNNSLDFEVENIGKPINSSKDDFGIYETEVSKKGFFTSNRDGGKGDDDIYAFEILECKLPLNGIVRDKDSNEIIAGANITLYDSEAKELETTVADDNGAFVFTLDCSKEYLVRVGKETYSSEEKRFSSPHINNSEIITTLFLELDEQEVKVGDDLAVTLDIPIIYFDFDKSNIRYDASLELEKVLTVLNTYPTMQLDIRSHTDSRGPRAYNEKLSDSRAKSTRSYLISKGIAPERLTAKGYGESQLKNKCSDNVECSDEEHQLNRRSEFIITKM